MLVNATGLARALQLCAVFSNAPDDNLTANFNALKHQPANANRPATTLLGSPYTRDEVQSLLTGFEGISDYIPDDALKFFCGVTGGLEGQDDDSSYALKDLHIVPGYYVMPFSEALDIVSLLNETDNYLEQFLGPDGKPFHFPILASGAGDYITVGPDNAVYALSAQNFDDEDQAPIAQNLAELFGGYSAQMENGTLILASNGLLVEPEVDDPELLDENLANDTTVNARRKRHILREAEGLTRRKRQGSLSGVMAGAQARARQAASRLSSGYRNYICRAKMVQFLFTPFKFRCSEIPKICRIDSRAVLEFGKPMVLEYDGLKGGKAKRVRKARTRCACRNFHKIVKKRRKVLNFKKGQRYPIQCEEYPFASTTQGGCGAHIGPVRQDENQNQGLQLKAFYALVKGVLKSCGSRKKKFNFVYFPDY